jgi:class 3 adenylate cyclase
VVPSDDSIGLGNDAVKLDATVLYADLADSTAMVDGYKADFAAEVYKAFLHCAAKIIRSNGGSITAYDGDRVMAVYIGDSKNSSAAKTAMQIHWAVLHVIQPAIKLVYTPSEFQLKHVVGIDTSEVLVARTGIRGSNDLVWVGRAANYAAKLASFPESHAKYITKDVYDKLRDDVKFHKGENMWVPVESEFSDGRVIYASDWFWSLS